MHIYDHKYNFGYLLRKFLDFLRVTVGMKNIIDTTINDQNG